MRARLFELVGLAVLLLGPLQGLTQDRGGSFANRPGVANPNDTFNRLANGKEVWVRSESASPASLRLFDRVAGRLGITSGQIAREQYLIYMGQGTGNGGGPGSSNTPALWWRAGGTRFGFHDRDGDGLLSHDEMPDTLQAERGKWDVDRNGLIDPNEFTAYLKAYLQRRLTEANAGPRNQPRAARDSPYGPLGLPGLTAEPVEHEDGKPVVYRAGKLPNGLPGWFTPLDIDNDAQIGLYEWKTSGWPLAEFQRIDRNDDGFLTIAEVLHHVAQAPDLHRLPLNLRAGRDSGNP